MRIIPYRYMKAIAELIERRLIELNRTAESVSVKVGLTNRYTLGKIILCRAALQPENVDAIARELEIDRRYLSALVLLQFHPLSQETINDLLAEIPTPALVRWIDVIKKCLEGDERPPTTREKAVLKALLKKRPSRR
jgi:hypothetical protein